VIETYILRALALQARGTTRGAVGTLLQALRLAEPDGYVRLFADEGAPMAALLADLIDAVCQRRLGMPDAALAYARSLLATCRPGEGGTPTASVKPGAIWSPPDPAAGVSPLIDPLTEREVEVLRLLAGGATNTAIAATLVVSVGTVKKHVFNICHKMGVQNRTQAVARARALRLL
jgi:LuxR family maltose regulon positive regulatory protein